MECRIDHLKPKTCSDTPNQAFEDLPGGCQGGYVVVADLLKQKTQVKFFLVAEISSFEVY